ncbi:hypothetical protein [Streptomyces sp. NPDC059455]|uniref:hypothetical protein n=1 Tax=Streptomyces sp. NPDC059455 TaxID=3346837 RepID=UPI0036ACF566
MHTRVTGLLRRRLDDAEAELAHLLSERLPAVWQGRSDPGPCRPAAAGTTVDERLDQVVAELAGQAQTVRQQAAMRPLLAWWTTRIGCLFLGRLSDMTAVAGRRTTVPYGTMTRPRTGP